MQASAALPVLFHMLKGCAGKIIDSYHIVIAMVNRKKKIMIADNVPQATPFWYN